MSGKRHSTVPLGDLRPTTVVEAKMDAQEALALDVAVLIENQLRRMHKDVRWLVWDMKLTCMDAERILQGDSTMTLRRLSDIAFALGCSVEVTFKVKGAR